MASAGPELRPASSYHTLDSLDVPPRTTVARGAKGTNNKAGKATRISRRIGRSASTGRDPDRRSAECLSVMRVEQESTIAAPIDDGRAGRNLT